jgi:hypothetical protein
MDMASGRTMLSARVVFVAFIDLAMHRQAVFHGAGRMASFNPSMSFSSSENGQSF